MDPFAAFASRSLVTKTEAGCWDAMTIKEAIELSCAVTPETSGGVPCPKLVVTSSKRQPGHKMREYLTPGQTRDDHSKHVDLGEVDVKHLDFNRDDCTHPVICMLVTARENFCRHWLLAPYVRPYTSLRSPADWRRGRKSQTEPSRAGPSYLQKEYGEKLAALAERLRRNSLGPWGGRCAFELLVGQRALWGFVACTTSDMRILSAFGLLQFAVVPFSLTCSSMIFNVLAWAASDFCPALS
ncbi:unnamed protein product [Symbiodinium sp. CCMP2592]|nr:unnamed protein product [Symbiodinium sp. CCMP2592]